MAKFSQICRKGYVVCDRAMLEPNKAWKDSLELRSYELDQAISQSHVLYFVSTMEDFEDVRDSTSSNELGEEHTEGMQSIDRSSALCVEHPGCADLKLTGYCCPPQPGAKDLGCCNALGTTDESGSVDNVISESNASCSDNEGCAALGLSGLCCPTSGGIDLSCCN